MTTHNFDEWIRVRQDLDAAALSNTSAWYILGDQNQVVPVGFHEWREWGDTRATPVIWCCTVGDVQIITAFFGEGSRLFETARVSKESGLEIVERYLIWPDAETGHRRWVDKLRTTLGE